MEKIRDDNITILAERIGYHYHLNIANRVLRPIMRQLYLDRSTWNHIESFTEKLEMYRRNGFPLDDLYKQIAACTRLIETIQSGLTVIKSKLIIEDNPDVPDRQYRQTIMDNFPQNVKLFAEKLNILFMLVMEHDKRFAGINKPLYTQMPELEGIGDILASECC
ncbi:MAG: hypothetical protein FWD47_07685 [Treponema sp.]|nr:hypothetical protein [Treponema sp.]